MKIWSDMKFFINSLTFINLNNKFVDIKSSLHKYKTILVDISIIFAVALFLRVYNLENWPRWYVDEGMYGIYTTSLLHGTDKIVIEPHFHTTFFILLSGITVMIFGENYFGLRLPGAMMGATSVVLFYIIVKKIYNRQIALISSILLTISTVYINRVALLDNGVEFFFLLTIISYIFYRDTDKNLWIYIAWIFAGLSFLTKWTGAVSLIFMILQSLTDKKFLKIIKGFPIYLTLLSLQQLIGLMVNWKYYLKDIVGYGISRPPDFIQLINFLLMSRPDNQLTWSILEFNLISTIGFISIFYILGRNSSNKLLLNLNISAIITYIAIGSNYWWAYSVIIYLAYSLNIAVIIYDIAKEKENFHLSIFVFIIMLPLFTLGHLYNLTSEIGRKLFYLIILFFLITNLKLSSLEINRFNFKYHNFFQIFEKNKTYLFRYFVLISITTIILLSSNFELKNIASNEVVDQRATVDFLNSNIANGDMVAASSTVNFLLNGTGIGYQDVAFYTTKIEEPLLSGGFWKLESLPRYKHNISVERFKYIVLDTPFYGVQKYIDFASFIKSNWILVGKYGDYSIYLNPQYENSSDSFENFTLSQSTIEKIIWVASSVPRVASNNSGINISNTFNNSFNISLASTNDEYIPLSVESRDKFNTSSIVYLSQTFLQPDTTANSAYDFKIVYNENNILIAHYIINPKNQYLEIGKIMDGAWYPQYYKQKKPPEEVDWRVKITPEKYIFYENGRKLIEDKNNFGNSSFRLSFTLTTNDKNLKTWEINRMGVVDEKSVNISGMQVINIYQLPQLGEVIEKSGFAVKLSEFSNIGAVSLIKLSVANIENKEKSFDLEPSPALIDDLGNQYDMVKIERSSQIEQTNIYPGVIRKGQIFFKPINPNAKYLRLILYLNGEKYEFGMKAESKILQDDGIFSNTSAKIAANSTMGETITQDGFAVMLKGFYNTQDWTSQVNIAVKNMENEDKPFNLNPAPALIDDLGNQYDMVKIERGSQIKQTNIYPGVIRKGAIFFKPINPNAKLLKLVLYINNEKYEFSFKPNANISTDDSFFNNISVGAINSTGIIKTVTKEGFDVKINGFYNSPDWASKVLITARNIDNEEKLFDLNPAPVIIDDLGNQYERVKIEGSNQIESSAVYPSAERKGAIFFEPINSKAKLLKLILYINGEKYEFVFEPDYNINKTI